MLKQIHGSDLVGAVRTVAGGRSLLDPKATATMLRRLRDDATRKDPLAMLTDQERRILEYIGEGMTNRQIGESMFLAEKTVKNHVSRLLGKLGMRRRTQAAVYATRLRSGRRQPTGTHHTRRVPRRPRAGTPRRCRPGRPPASRCSAAPLRRPPEGSPTPSSSTTSVTSPPLSSSDTSTRSAPACRTTFDSASRSTASTWSATSSATP